MESFLDYQNTEICNIKSSLDDLSDNLKVINSLDKSSKINIIDKLSILNKELYNIDNLVNEILLDMYNGNSNIDIKLRHKLEQLKQNDKLIHKISPLLLFLQLIEETNQVVPEVP